jgi:hypothetical protein
MLQLDTSKGRRLAEAMRRIVVYLIGPCLLLSIKYQHETFQRCRWADGNAVSKWTGDGITYYFWNVVLFVLYLS